MISRFFISLFFLSFFFTTLIAEDSFNFAQNTSLISLYGDAKLIKNSTSLQLTSSRKGSFGSVIYKKPIKKFVSISTYFTFYPSYGNTLAFHMFPDLNGSFGMTDSRKFSLLSVEFEEPVKVLRNLPSADLVVNAGRVKLQTWIDYEAGSKRLELRVNSFGENRPVDPVLVAQVDLCKIWPKINKVFMGLSSMNRNSTQGLEVDSWRFKASIAPNWMHSQLLDSMVLQILVALILGIGCGALGTFVGMFMCTLLSSRKRRPIVPEEFDVKSLQEYAHKKLKIVLDEASTNKK